ncbi:MAG: YggT family protein [Pseudomonadota bacterium]
MFDLLLALYNYFLSPLLTLLIFVLLAYVIMGWLFTFGVINPHNPTARQIFNVLHSIVDPMARPIRRFVPPLGQLDLSILILFLIIQFVNGWLLPRVIMVFA